MLSFFINHKWVDVYIYHNSNINPVIYRSDRICKHFADLMTGVWNCDNQIVKLGRISIYLTGSAKRGLIADPNGTYLEILNFTCESGTTLKLGPNIPLA